MSFHFLQSFSQSANLREHLGDRTHCGARVAGTHFATVVMLRKLVPVFVFLAVCSSNQNLKWDDLEEEQSDSGFAEAPLLGRNAAIDLCPVPAAPKNSKVQCRKGRGRRMCRAVCLKGFKLPNGEKEQIIACSEDEGIYAPKGAFVDCEAHCEAPCQNGGRCIGSDECVCEAAFRGDLCQYPVSLCDSHFSEFLGTWRCGHKKNGTECQIGCPVPFYFSFESPKIHTCSVDGVWTPPKVPTCIADDPDLELVPGEVTRNEMEDKNHGTKKNDDDDEYEIYETINADKPVEQANSIVIEAQDATNNIKRRIRCPEGQARVRCLSDCRATCQNPNLVCPPADEGAQCEEGCACAEGFLQLGDTCVPRKACPCYHEGFASNQGHYIVQDCNTCTCHEGNWQCTNEVCDSECSVLVNTFYKTFDGHAYYTGAGPCLMVLMQVTNGPQIVQDRGSCPEDPGKVCVGDLVINLGEEALRVTSDRRVMLNHRDISIFPADFRRHQIVITKPSKEFLQVNVNGISILTDGRSQMSVKASSTFFNRTVGLCGTFNHQRSDDFTTPNVDVTTSAISFAEQWTVGRDQCSFTRAGNCSTVHDQEERRTICDNLFRDATAFPTCLDKIAPELLYEQCIEAMCTCTSSAEECLCPFLRHYSRLCSNKGSITDWTLQVPQCAIECHRGMRYQQCSTACHSTCSHRSFFGQNCSGDCVEGCACPGGTSLSSAGVCLPYEKCLCYFDGNEYQDGFRHARNHETCLCRKGLWECEVATEDRDHSEVPETHCGVNEVFSQCVDRCAPTCDALTRVPSCDNTICARGCQCAEGFVRNELTGKCTKRRDCPCFHNGRKYNEGETVTRGCNKCTCANATWSCSNEPCPASCDVWGNTHIKTFDDQMLDFEGTCDYVVTKAESDSGNAGWFQVVLRNFKCASDTIECRKSILVQYENQSIVLSGMSWTATSAESYLEVLRIGSLYTKVTLPNQVTIYWDGDTRLHVIAGVQWKERVSGLCGNFNGDDSDELRASSEGPLVHSVAEFVKTWQLFPQCKPPQIKNFACLETTTRARVEQKCQVLRGSVFEDCHNEVDVEPYLKRCVADACSCSENDECGCFCTAVAAYAHKCAQEGVLIRWRHQELCPLQCDEDCERYTPCVPEVCRSSQTCEVVVKRGVQLNCAEPFCVEGCSIPTCKPGFVHPNETTHECLPATTCNKGLVERSSCRVGNSTFAEGQRIDNADPCVSCFCIRGERKCFGRPCAESVAAQPSCSDGWSEWKSVTSPSSAFGYDVEYLAHHRCPSNSIAAVECRRIHDHASWNESHQGVICDTRRGLECAPRDVEACADWEMRVRCSCPAREDGTIGLIPLPQIHEETRCPSDQQWSPCALNCAQTCHKFRRDLMLQGQCLDRECAPGCTGEPCRLGQVHAGPEHCVQVSDCPCVRPGGEIVAPGAVFLKDECTECQCLNNDFLCHRLSKCDQTEESSEVETIRVDPEDGCWTQWISTSEASAAGDFENLQELIKMNLVCEEPKAIQCRTKESQRSPGGIDWTATGQSLVCDVHRGLSCFHTANSRDGCFDYEVKFFCPCEQTSQTVSDLVDPIPIPSTITHEFYCEEPNGLFPDPSRCDHFYHCSNGHPFHKPCPEPLQFNPVLKVCDWPINVHCGTDVSVAPFSCPSSMGLFSDTNNCNWFYHCVQNVAYHKLCPAGLSFNPQSGNCDFMSTCRNEHELVIPPGPPPAPLPFPVATGDSHTLISPPITFACPETLPGSAQTCGHCPVGLLCDGFGNCVPPESCPCVRDGKQFPTGGRIESTTCQECICQIGGHSMCIPMMCPLCPNGIVGTLDNACDCHCEDYELVTECPKLCGNGQCLDPSRWCDGIVDCDDDETQCSNGIDPQHEILPSYDLVQGPATCELIGSHLKTFDGRDLSYDYCHHLLAEDVANKLFRVSVSRECASPSNCEPRVIFEGGNQLIDVETDSQAVSINRTRLTPAQLASANLGDVSVLAIGDIVEVAFQKQTAKLVITKNSVRLTVNGRFKNQLMGLCGLFNYAAKDDFTNTAGMVVDNEKLFGDSWALPPSPGAICVSHACEPEVTIEAMRICGKLSLAPLSACAGLADSFRNCIAYTCQCLQTKKTGTACLCDALAAFQKTCVEKHGSQIINKMTGWRQQNSCVPKCPPDQRYQDCGTTCVVTCQNFFETGNLSCVSDSESCIPGCFCPPGFVLDYTTNSCIEPDACADKVCVGYGDPQVKTFDGYSFSLDKSGSFNIATDRDGLFTVRGLNAPCSERLSCVVGLEVEHNGTFVIIQRNRPVTINDNPLLEDALPWTAPDTALSVFSLHSGSVGTTVVSLSRLGVQVHYSHENAAFSIHVPSKKFFDKMEGLCGNCNNDPNDDLKLKDGETTDDIYGFICSWGRFETEQNRRECVMEFGREETTPPGPIIEACEQVFSNGDAFSGCHALVDHKPYAEQCSKEAASLSTEGSGFKTAVCSSALEYSRRCCEHGVPLQWWKNLECDTTCPGDLIYASCTSACPQTCEGAPAENECHKIRVHGCVCPPDHVKDGTRCTPKSQICTTPAGNCNAVPIPNSARSFEHQDPTHGLCTNPDLIPNATMCSGACESVSFFKHEYDIESSCGCCVPQRWTPILVPLQCADGELITREFRRPISCECEPCGTVDSRRNRFRALPDEGEQRRQESSTSMTVTETSTQTVFGGLPLNSPENFVPIPIPDAQ